MKMRMLAFCFSAVLLQGCDSGRMRLCDGYPHAPAIYWSSETNVTNVLVGALRLHEDVWVLKDEESPRRLIEQELEVMQKLGASVVNVK